MRRSLAKCCMKRPRKYRPASTRRKRYLISWFRDKGIQVNEIDKKPFQDAVLPKLTDWDNVPYNKEQFDRLQAL